ncbi:hypothetical protein JCM3766R1_003530 [Sporobolomyces carnicolor]
MPPVFGGAPTCPTCSGKVYFAEQAIGPGGRAFHKSCIKCTSCNKVLEPRLLVDHDGDAYCKNCHAKSFGTKGYGAGGALVGDYQPRSSPTRPTAASSPVNSPIRPAAAGPPPPPARPTVPPKPSFTSTAPVAPTVNEPARTPSTRAPESGRDTTHSTPAFSDDDEEDSRPTTTRRPLPFPPSQFAPKSVTSSPDLCRRCGTQVYFAEQVIAVGSRWHKRCLRCASCSTTLNSHLLEKDRLPYCKKCYQENFGTGSLGITSRPTLY